MAALCDGAGGGATRQGGTGRSTVERPWSRHNPRDRRRVRRPAAIRPYLERELAPARRAGAASGARGRARALALNDPALLRGARRGRWDLRQKKLFLFRPERMALSFDRLAHYTGTPAEAFQRHVLFTNYAHARRGVPRAVPGRRARPAPGGRCRPGTTAVRPGRRDAGRHRGRPVNAKTITDHVGVLRPDLLLMIGHCGGLRNHQDIGDFVLATDVPAGRRRARPGAAGTSRSAPTTGSTATCSTRSSAAACRTGSARSTRPPTATGSSAGAVLADMRLSRAVAVDMESATVAANGFRYRIPNATLLWSATSRCTGGRSWRARQATFYERRSARTLEIALEAVDRLGEPTGRARPRACRFIRCWRGTQAATQALAGRN